MQKFHKGDWVRVAKDLGPSMSHFTADCEAIVIGSYDDKYGGGNLPGDRSQEMFTLHLKEGGQCSWYYESQLTLIESGRLDKLQAWEEEQEAESKQKSDLDWIFANGRAVLTSAHGASIAALANSLGITSLWGSRGEGFTYYQNALRTLALAEPYLKVGNKAGWLAHCASLRAYSRP